MDVDVSGYPSNHQCLIYSTSENVPAYINEVLEDLSNSLTATKLTTMLAKVSKALENAGTGDSADDAMEIDDEEEVDFSDGEDEDIDSTGAWSPQSPAQGSKSRNATMNIKRSALGHSATKAFKSRIRHDLRVAKEAGFKVGHLGLVLEEGEDSFVSISCRISKLGISDEALQAWHLDRRQYLIFLIHYTAGYKPLDHLVAKEASHDVGAIEMRVGLSYHYKPSLGQAIAAFSQISKDVNQRPLGHSADASDQSDKLSKDEGLQGLFIGRPLNELINKRLILVLRSRMSLGIGWGGAEAFYNDCQGRTVINTDAIGGKYWQEDDPSALSALPQRVRADHLKEPTITGPGSSFPLLGMQFVLRHLVRCTEFCLVCHCKVEADFEALKPYVCSRPLCLYQYMTLGFGPSIEYEILTQPYVVDLLVSFCYSSAKGGRLTDFPVGMGLMVPPPHSGFSSSFQASVAPSLLARRNGVGQVAGKVSDGLPSPSLEDIKNLGVDASRKPHKVNFDHTKMEIVLTDTNLGNPLKKGDWIVLEVSGTLLEDRKLHCRVIETAYFPTVNLAPPVVQAGGTGPSLAQQFGTTPGPLKPPVSTPATTPPPSALTQASFTTYNQQFDELSEHGKRSAICGILETLPTVMQMREYLRGRKQSLDLEGWVDRLSPTARGLLRWIIASNRSCIVQVDKLDDKCAESGITSHPEQRVYGMSQWMQFRFAQGAPDKEQRFVNSVRDATGRLQLKYPTIFAWHGSPLPNWHGIVREGLHFKETLHGRAHGHGCYHALDAGTSMTFSGSHSGYSGTSSSGWPQSLLKITSAIALNEIVNAPGEFVSRSPHLVVAQLDWIQSRYLFVKNTSRTISRQDTVPAQIYEQDPAFTPRGDTNENIVIPATAVSKSRRPSVQVVKNGNKKAKILNGDDEEVAQQAEDDAASVDTEAEDLSLLLSDTEEEESPKTDFLPGTLDHTTLPLLEPPAYATPMASKSLQKMLASTLHVQETEPAHGLGWYINPELISNIYQWIVELHSFEPNLPLAKDMKAKGLKSVVLEMRFGKDYPMSPPFVRVIRPRFLSFMAGGGGHVTAGGALCMELLTSSGWIPVSPIETVLLQIRLAISSTDPKPARLEPGPVRDYGIGEAVDAFVRACAAHGWTVPKDFHAFSSSARSSSSR